MPDLVVGLILGVVATLVVIGSLTALGALDAVDRK